MRRMGWLGVVLLTCAAAAAEQKPAGEKSQAPPDLATPKRAAIAFVRAMEADDMTAFKEVTLGSDEDYQLFEPLLRMTGAAKKMEKAARDKFGRDGSKVVRQSPAVGLEVHVQESDVKVDGDHATLKHREDGDAEALPLKKTAAGWKVDLTAIPNRRQMTAAAGAMHRIQEALEAVTGEILDGKFKTADQAVKALLARMKAAARQP